MKSPFRIALPLRWAPSILVLAPFALADQPVTVGQLRQLQEQATTAMMQAMQHPGATAPAPVAAAPRLRVLKDTPLQVVMSLTLPDGNVVLETVTVLPNLPYVPTPSDRQLLQQGHEVFGPKLAWQKGGQLVLQYVVPNDAMPAAVRRSYPVETGMRWLPLLINQAHAGVNNFWTGMQTAIGKPNNKPEGLAPYLGSLQPTVPWAKLQSNYGRVSEAMDFSDQESQWMMRLDALEQCARHPTQTVTQNAYRQNPQYQQQTIDAIEQARTEVKQATGAWYVNEEASVGSQLIKGVPGLLSNLSGKMSSWNDTALRQIGDGLVTDAAKLVDCDLAPPPLHGRDGSIKYRMQRSGYLGYDEENRLVYGTFDLQLAGLPGAFKAIGTGTFKGSMKSTRFSSKAQCSGTSTVQGGGVSGRFWISASPDKGTCLFTDINGTHDVGPSNSDTSFRCSFSNVDLVNGGHYTVHADGEESQWAFCDLELTPRQR